MGEEGVEEWVAHAYGCPAEPDEECHDAESARVEERGDAVAGEAEEEAFDDFCGGEFGRGLVRGAAADFVEDVFC